jgi:hypothetical protein
VNKYHAIKATIDGLTFDSQLEAHRWWELSQLEKAGQIKDLRCHVRFEIIPKTRVTRAHYYTVDFTYTEGGVPVVEDVKGVLTRDYVLRRDLLISSGATGPGAVFREYTRKGIKDFKEDGK